MSREIYVRIVSARSAYEHYQYSEHSLIVTVRVMTYELRQEKIRATYWITGNKAYLNSDAGSDVLNRKSTLDLVCLHPSLALNRCVARMLHAHP